MSSNFLNLINRMKAMSVESFIGYGEAEIAEIEKIYDIKVTGNFRKFLSIAGRSAGGAIGDYEVVLYYINFTRQSHLTFQQEWRKDLREEGWADLMSMKPFFISVEAEAYYFFIATLEKEDVLYVYDENNGSLEKTKFSFVSYMERQLSHELKIRERQQSPSYIFSRDVIVCKGDLLKE